MARPSKCRRICFEPAYDSFVPSGIGSSQKVVLSVDEYEAVRLIDLEKFTHEQCARQMGISRTTVTEIYETAREKLADSIVNGKMLQIAGGNYQLCDGSVVRDCQKFCRRSKKHFMGQPEKRVQKKGANTMRLAVTYENGQIFQHFGHTEQFKLYDIEDGKIVNEQVVDTNGQGHGALSGFLSSSEVEALICGGIGGGAQMALAEAGIKLYGGVSGNADEAVQAFLAGNLGYNPNVHCSHHTHEHSCGEHACGEEKHGCAGNGGCH
ncbi:MAG: DUF134 domain-containing protein [Lachnospiraceae bacterium]|nr:DUF134 domain-containing protein [Lachnospiraceae bacterium]